MTERPIILVVEDEYELQAILDEDLTESGFAPEILSSAEEALTLFRGRVKEYRALVADVNLRGRLSGWEIARQVREKEPTFPVIYTTAASAHEWPSQGVPNSILLTKPFAPAQLITALSQLLNTGSPEKSMLRPSD